jgi:ubiquinone/menaquinone biosynthesis C-methylase UbiE
MTAARDPREADSPRHDKALRQYRRRAPYYDLELALFEPVRRTAIERLALQPGDIVLDVGCGTGLSMPLLEDCVGAQGRIVGIEQSPEMIERARVRTLHHGWSNVTLLNGEAEAADVAGAIEHAADAALFHFTHDILREPNAVANVLRNLRPGARVVASGLQWADKWAWPLNLFVLGAALHSVTSLSGMDQPWSHLGTQIDQLHVDSAMAGAIYVVSGVVPGVARGVANGKAGNERRRAPSSRRRANDRPRATRQEHEDS